MIKQKSEIGYDKKIKNAQNVKEVPANPRKLAWLHARNLNENCQFRKVDTQILKHSKTFCKPKNLILNLVENKQSQRYANMFTSRSI
ncbi:hypothetical protein HYD88_00690 [Mycoplasmopsis bovis]|nr:hypothetical protein HYD88_00690 [Mycoplasmopsis bovis]